MPWFKRQIGGYGYYRVSMKGTDILSHYLKLCVNGFVFALISQCKMKLTVFSYWILVKLSTISYINSETNPPLTIVNVVCKYLRQFLGTSFGVTTLPKCCNIENRGGNWFISEKWTNPEFPKFFWEFAWSQ